MTGSTRPLVVEQVVAVPPAHAFAVWTERFATWWPPTKSFAGADRVARIVLEPGVGGRIHEIDEDGAERDWGRITAWDPPRSVRFTWHLMFAPQDATDVLVEFLPEDRGTLLRVTHGGWDALPSDVAAERRQRNEAGWTALLPVFAAAAEGHVTASPSD